MAIAKITEIAILAVMATIVMANDTFRKAKKGVSDYVLFTPVFHCKTSIIWGRFCKNYTSHDQKLFIKDAQGWS